MKRFVKASKFVFAIALLFATLACSNPEGKSAELYETAQFEEQQDNLKHAKSLYEEIITKYPSSSLVPKAKERLEALKQILP